MSRQRKRSVEAFGLSFLDCICCGLGTIILLLVLSKIYEPAVFEEAEANPREPIAMLQEELFEMLGEAAVVNRELVSARQITTDTKISLTERQQEFNSVQAEYRLLTHAAPDLQTDEGELRAARQRLTEEMARLQPDFRRAPDDAVGGIPVDSEYIVFVIDTSGSMLFKWDFIMQKLEEVLNVYPAVQGLQILNDNGTLMFPRHGRRWLEDTPQVRQAIKNTMREWAPHSDSNPADGLIYALETFSDPAKKVSIYVFGDDFAGRSAEAVIRHISRINVADVEGNRPARIHAVGFPSFGKSQAPAMAQRYAGLMRVVTERNGGTFVGLTERDRR